MKPVSIIRHSRTEEPSYFATFLDAQPIPWRLIAIDQNESVPEHMGGFSGLCLMGGPISVNEPLPWIDQVCALIHDASAHDIPVIGHCLWGQLISKAMGGQVCLSSVKEIGWSRARVEINDGAKFWLGNLEVSDGQTDIFQWHGETFSIPPGGQRILTKDFLPKPDVRFGPTSGHAMPH